MKYGCIGEHLGHSFSKEIHQVLSDNPYVIREIPREDLNAFMAEGNFLGINVTIPYKQAVIPYLDEIDEAAKEIGAVNTIVNDDGTTSFIPNANIFLAAFIAAIVIFVALIPLFRAKKGEK